jgi:hypothetical protein
MGYSQASRGLTLKPQFTWFVFCKTTLTATAVWVFVAVPVAAAVSAVRLSLLFLFVLPEMAATAAILGAIHGLWVFLANGPSQFAGSRLPGATASSFRWFGVISGGVLGLLGFLPVYSHTTVLAVYPLLIASIAAAICGGAAAGFAFCWILSAKLFDPPPIGQSLITGSLLVLALGAMEYAAYWNGTADRLPLLKFAVTNLPAGDAKDTAWSDCYEYRGIASDGNGGDSGILLVKQRDGLLELSSNRNWALQGGVDQQGRFSAGAETTRDGITFRTLWEGRFGSGLVFTERTTALRDGSVVNITAIWGIGERTGCKP